MPWIVLPSERGALGSKTVGDLQKVLRTLNHVIERRDVARKELGTSTVNAIKAFQRRVNLPQNGRVTATTVAALNAEIEHAFVVTSKTRTRRLQEDLQRVGISVEPDEMRTRSFGERTMDAVKAYQTRAGLKPDGRVNDALLARLREDTLAARWDSKTQVAKLQRTLVRALSIAKLTAKIESDEVKDRTIGDSTREAIKAVQKKCGLPATGKLDVATHDRIVSLGASAGRTLQPLKARASQLVPIRRVARLNMTGPHVVGVQQALAVLGHTVDQSEFRRQQFGRSTREAVLEYQRAKGLARTGHVDGDTLVRLNAEVQRANPDVAPAGHACRVRGSVRDELWRGLGGLRVQVHEKLIAGNGALLCERATAANGFFDVPYDAPLDTATGQAKNPYHLQVTVLKADDTALAPAKLLSNPTRIDWVNFTLGDQPYRGVSEFEERTRAVLKAIAPVTVDHLVEKPNDAQISRAAQASGMLPEDVMRLVLSALVAKQLNKPALGAAACYAYIAQSLPASLPGDLLDATEEWDLIDPLVSNATTGLVFMDPGLEALAFDNAVTANLIPISIGRQRAAILAALAALRESYTLEKPLLVGNGSLKGLLDTTAVGAVNYGAVASAFLNHRSFGPAFWEDLKSRPAEFGGAAAVRDFEATVEVGHIAKNFVPMVTELKKQLADPAVLNINAPRDLAKLTAAEWVTLINGNGGQVPPGTDGATPADQVRTYAQTLASHSELLFPAVALAATVARSAANPLPHVTAVQALLDDHPDFDLRSGNLDVYVQQQNLVIPAATLTEARVMQRVHRLAPTAVAGQALLDLKLHSSSQIVALGKGRFTKMLTGTTLVDERIARTVFGLAQFQYAQVLQRLTEYRFDLHRADPKAIIDHTYRDSELPAELAGIPDLKMLFGSLDYCDCSHCQSVYGPAAYLADLLRWLSTHESEIPGKTVQTILFERRPDIGNIKLNCENTETPLPYIDLVCEILENAIDAPASNPNFSNQTTLDRAQLRAGPEHVRDAAYDTVLNVADYPMDVSFDLRQEEARVFLTHLGVPRWKLMEAYQARPVVGPNVPADSSVAGEYFGMSSHQTTIITTAEATIARQTAYWGFDASDTERTVADFLRRSRLEYRQLLELLNASWVNPGMTLVIERPEATCDTEVQKLKPLSAAGLDRMHRFLRLWRSTGWDMWELDLMLRNGTIGGGQINGDTLVRLKQLKQVQQKLALTAEQALSFYGDINTEVRKRAEDPQQTIQPLYVTMFLNPGVTTPVDQDFALSLAGGLLLSQHKATLLAAFALNEADLALLLTRIGSDALTIGNLSRLARYAVLARGLALPVKDLLALEALCGAAGIFANPRATLDFIETSEWVTKSGLAVQQLDYLLNHRPDSPYGLRDEVITEYVRALRDALRGNTAGTPDGTVTAHAATAFALPPEQARLLLRDLRLGGRTLLVILTDPALTAQDAVTGDYVTAAMPANFADAYNAYRLLHKAALLLTRLEVSSDNLEWLLANAGTFELLPLGALPVAAPPGAPLFPGWLALYRWLHVNSLYPQPEGSALRDVFDLAKSAAAPVADIHTAIAKLMPWKKADLEQVAMGLGLQHTAGSLDYAKVTTWLRLATAFEQLKRLGAGADLLPTWARRDLDSGTQRLVAQQVRQAAKSKYDAATWLQKVTPLEDALREKKRDALISYLVETSLRAQTPTLTVGGKTYANPAWWRNGDDLLNYYLIDVQMSACQLTSRIKQAMSSVQMFAQRCLLGLERPRVEVSRAQQLDVSSENSWKQWQWMKSYRVWEANRKVFLYPENWIEPELRDDKSPFFEELEAEVMQHDITDENVEAAFLNYLQKVHEVARLDIVGAYHEVEDTDPRDNLPPDVNRLHVIGRTGAHPAVWYYRLFDLNLGEWTAWQKIDLDIESEQVTLVVYNRKLHLFWLNFIEKPQKVKKQPAAQAGASSDTPEPPSQLEIQLAWSTYRDGAWTAKHVSRRKLVHPWQRPQHTYNLKPRYKRRENLLWLDLYISQSPEFNNGKFWDAYRSVQDYVARRRFDPTSRPWHSSSFVFDGEVVDLHMKGLWGYYRTPDANGIPQQGLTLTDSWEWVHSSFGADGRAIKLLEGPYEIAPRLPLPLGMHYDRTRLTNNPAGNTSNANVLENGSNRPLLNAARPPFEIVFSQHRITFDTMAWGAMPFFYQDSTRAFFIKPEVRHALTSYNQTVTTVDYRFYPFYHPYTALFMRELNRSGLEGLLNRRIQTAPETYYPGNNYGFSGYGPTAASGPDPTALKDTVDFERYGAYAIYNWEIFFHAPLMIACKLSVNQRFAEAMRWFHTIFDPTNAESPDVPQRFWIPRPFYEQNSDAYRQQRIDVLLKNINQHRDQLTAWKNDPFKPHLIARFRPVAYQKTVVMKYVQNLTDWADQLFRRDTIEAINEATTLYVLAYEILGRRPVKVPNVEHTDQTYNELAGGGLDPFGNKRVEILMENFTGTPVRVTRTQGGTEPLPNLDVFYFSIPNNDRLLGYWSTIEQRLFNIRNCRNIAGAFRQLPLFEPEIDPALLVKAAAAGADLDSILDNLAAPASPYRFQRLAQRAMDLCSEVKALGDKLLAALEKQDAEGLALLRSRHEIALHQAVRTVRKLQIKEATEALAGLQKSRTSAEQKKAFYEGREFMNAWEITALSLGGVSAAIQTSIALGYVLAGGLTFIPRFVVGASGFGGSPEVNAAPVDGARISKATEYAVTTLSAIATAADKIGSLAATVGNYQRRQDDWTFQAELATTELAQMDKQIAAAEVRLGIAEQELENQEMQLEQSQAASDYLKDKYTNEQLYDWQVRQVVALYFQSFKLTYDTAKRAEKCFQFERGQPDQSFVQFGYWDSLKKGLLAGERLSHDIRRMEAAYLDENARDLEISKHVSLAQFQPLSLMALKETGSCTVVLPEWLFDMDYPGHFRRRLKSVSLSIPCVVGPYTGVNCTLALTRNVVRLSDAVALPRDAAAYGNPLLAADARFYNSPVPVSAIATSHGQNDSGMFELNFNDERYLPFEGAGAVSEWSLTLRREDNQFDPATIADVVLHIRYTATASDGQDLAVGARANLAATLPASGLRLLVLNQDFATEWHRFLNADPGTDQVLAVKLGREHLPFYTRGKANIKLKHVDLIAESTATVDLDVKLTVPGGATSGETLATDLNYGRHYFGKGGFAPATDVLGDWTLQIRLLGAADWRALAADTIRNAYLVLGFQAT